MDTNAIKPLYVLNGEDAFLRDTHRQEILKFILDGADPQTCLSTYDSTAELAEVLDELRTLPFLAPCRVVVITDADAFVSRHRAKLEDYLNSPTETATLILAVSSWPSNTRLYKLVKKIGQVMDCNVQAGSMMQRASQRADKRGKKIARDAAELLVEWLGNDLGALDGEIEKLSLYIGDKDMIRAEDVSLLVTATAGPGIFDLTNSIVAGNTSKALKALGGMLTTRGEEFRVLGLIASNLRKALRAQQLISAGKSPELHMPYSARSDFLAMLKRRPLATLQKDFRKLIRADLGMKSGLDASAALQELVVGLTT